jgi:hypothetical protein
MARSISGHVIARFAVEKALKSRLQRGLAVEPGFGCASVVCPCRNEPGRLFQAEPALPFTRRSRTFWQATEKPAGPSRAEAQDVCS